MKSNRWNFSRTALSAAVALLAVAPVMAQSTADEEKPRPKEDAVRLGTITIVGEGNKLAAGQMLNEDSVKGRSTVTKAALEKDLATGNSLQSLALLPSVNTYSYDATGLFGGSITVRGFGADQLGITVNGVPVNDSGNFAVYPQEYIDSENVCTTSIAQGSPELEAPHSGATGGSISIITCDPGDKFSFRGAETLGGLSMSRTYMRIDSGRFANDMAKVFLSYSHTEADKWKGKGQAKKDHVDFGFSLDLSPDNRLLGSVLYNRAVNNNFLSMSLEQLNDNGYYYDYAETFKAQQTPVNGTAQTETSQSPLYYGMAINPFQNMIASVSGSFKLAKDTFLKVQPYYWYGFGNGGWGEQRVDETGVSTTSGVVKMIGGAVDVNGDGDTLDLVRVGRASVTKTQRPGVTAELSTTLANHYLKFGLWYERADHRQTQPAVLIGSDGSPTDIWLEDGLLTRADGSTYQNRNWKTISTSYQAYVNDQISFMNDRGLLSLGLRAPTVERDVTNYTNETNRYDYNIKRSFSEWLPQLGTRFNLDRRQQVFFNIAKNFRAPPNYAYTGSYVEQVDGAVSPKSEIKPETSVMTDVGYRYQSPAMTFSATLFHSKFKDRQSTAYNPNDQVSTYTNAGRVNNRGLELEVGSGKYKGFSAYGSLTLQKSKIKDNIAVSSSSTLATAGKQFTLTPEAMIGTSVQYEMGPFYARVKVKYTGSQYATLMNDEKAPAYFVGDLDAGYKFDDFGLLRNPQLRMNISNIGDAKYRSPTSGSVNTALTSTVYYYLGAPRLFTMSLSADF